MKLLSVLRWLLPPLAAGLLLGLTLWMPPPTISINIGNEQGLNDYAEARHLYSFLGWGPPEIAGDKLARRAEGYARFAVPYAFRLGSPLVLRLDASGWGVDGPTLLQLNETSIQVPTRPGWHSYRALVAQRPTLYQHDLYLAWRSSGEQGPLLHRVDLSARRPAGWLTGPAWLGASVALMVLLARQQSARSLLVWAGVVTASACLGRLLYAPQLLPWAALVALGGLAAVALTALCRDSWRRLALWLLVLWLLAAPQVLGSWLLDDAFISFRYARNLVEGAGLTFNPGGERVEGYTNFLWTLILAGTLAAGAEPVVTAQVLCTGLALATVLAVYRLAEAWWAGHAASLLPPLLLAVNPSFLLYTARGSGMETALVTLLTLLVLWLLWQAHSWQTGSLAGLACALLVMARPDGALVPLAGGLLLLARLVRPAARAQAWPTLAGLVGGFVLLYGPYFAWRFSYYGYLLPNTFYAKTGATSAQVLRGWDYTRDFFAAQGFWNLALLAALSLLALLWPRLRSQVAPGPAPLLWLFALLTLLYVTLVGGDHFPLGRFFVPLLPPLALLLLHGLQGAAALRLHLPRWPTVAVQAGALLAAALFVLVSLQRLPASDSRLAGQPIWGEHKVVQKNTDMGHWLRRNTPPDTVIATGIAGALPYYAERHVIDVLGLNDTYIAHLQVETMGQGIAGAEKFDSAYVLQRQPDYIPFSSAGEFLQVEQFRQEYRLIRVEGPLGGLLRIYQREDE